MKFGPIAPFKGEPRSNERSVVEAWENSALEIGVPENAALENATGRMWPAEPDTTETDAAATLFAADVNNAVRCLADSISGGRAGAGALSRPSLSSPDSGISPGFHPVTQRATGAPGTEDRKSVV